MRSRVTLFTALFAVGLFVVPQFAHAAAIPFFGPIIPQDANQAVCPAGWGMLITVINNIIRLLITLAIVLIAPFMIAYSGYLYVVNPYDPSGIAKAKSILANTILGIVIALAGWLIVDMLMAVLYNKNTPDAAGGVMGTWSSLISSGGASACLDQRGALPDDTLNQAPPGGGVVVAPGTGGTSESLQRQIFKYAGVSINHDLCPAGSSGSGCTNVGGMKDGTAAQVLVLASVCGSGGSRCPVTITGGTEPGHGSGTYSHANGYKVDLAPSTALDSYLKSMTYEGVRTGDGPGPAYTDRCGQNQYVRESDPDHWDITVYASCIPPK